MPELTSLRDGKPVEAKPATAITADTNSEGIAEVDGLPGAKILFRVEKHRFANDRFWMPVDLSETPTPRLIVKRP